MEWLIFSDPALFAEKAEPLLYKEEDKYSLFIGILGQIRDGRYEEFLLAAVEQEGRLAAACLMTPPHPLQLVVFEAVPDLNRFVAERLLEEGAEVNAVIGDREAVSGFAELWAEKTYRTVKVKMDEGLYRLDEVEPSLEKSPGTWRVAGKNDAELLEGWLILFEQETGLDVSSQSKARERIADFLDRKEVYVWEVDGKTVSCMKKGRPTKRSITVSFVFTPKEHRRKGYARTLVAEVSEELLETYEFCMLFTDLSNPTSNKIYREIGYRQIANPVHLVFE